MIAARLLALAGFAALVLGVLPSHVRAADEAKTGFLHRVHKDADGKEAKYVLFVPHDYKGDKPYPLILFLHGSGETGTDGEKQVKVGLGTGHQEAREDFPVHRRLSAIAETHLAGRLRRCQAGPGHPR